MPGDVIGVWQDRGVTLTLRQDGTALQESHIPGQRSQQFTEPQPGTYVLEGERLRFRWSATRSLPAREEACAYDRGAEGLLLRCESWSTAALFKPISAQERSAVSGLLLQISLSAAILTPVLVAGLLRRFRRRVLALMDARPADGSAPGLFKEIWVAGAGRTSGAAASAAMSRVARVYALAGAFALAPLVAGTALVYAERINRGLVLALALVLAWPLLIVVKEVTASGWRRMMRWVFGYGFLLVALAVWLRARNPDFSVAQMLLLWFVMSGMPTVFLLLFASRTLRVMGPVLFTASWIAMAGFWGFQHVASNQIAVLSVLSRVIGELPVFLWIPVTLLIGLLIALPGVWLILRGFAWAWERRWISDISLAMDSIFLIFCVLQATVSMGDKAPSLTLLWFVLAVGVWVVVRLIILLRSAKAAPHPPALLILRVFRIQNEPMRIFDQLSHRWRFVGPVRLIAGADLASRIIQPSSLLKFISGKLKNEFIGDKAELQRKMHAGMERPDPDGLFRVDEFFCHANMWLRAATVAAARSDAVVMDARSFTAERAGVRLELAMLLALVPASRILLIVDNTTRAAELEQAEQEAWAHLTPDSPNYGAATRTLQRFEIRGSSDREIDAVCERVFALTGAEPYEPKAASAGH